MSRKHLTTGKIVLIGCLFLALVVALPIIFDKLNTEKEVNNLLPPVELAQEVSIVGVRVIPPNTVTFYTNGIMTEKEKRLMVDSFLTAVVVPEKDLWVNLRDDERNRIAPFYLGRTELGRVMLEQDLLLKHATATAFHPHSLSGEKFWNAIDLYGKDIRLSTNMRSWIVPDKVLIEDSGREMYIKQADLSVNQEKIKEGVWGFQERADKFILPTVKEYVLKDTHFAPTRQVFRAVVCGIWFKNKFLNTIYHWSINSNKVGSFEIADSDMKYNIWDKYLISFKEHDYKDRTNRTWGGISFETPQKWIEVERADRTSSPIGVNERGLVGNIEQARKLVSIFSNTSYDYLISKQNEALEILREILKEENLRLTAKLETPCLEIVHQLYSRPDHKSQALAERVGVSVTELREIYRIIKNSPTLQEVVTEESRYSRLVEYTTKYLLRYSERLERAFNNQLTYPIIVEWHPGETCNSDCVFCYNKGLQYADKGKRGLIEIEKSKQLIDEWADNDVKEFWVSGGKEPLTNPTTADVIKYATDRGLLVKLYTNGINLIPEFQPKLLGAKWVRVSINAGTPETYHTVQGIRADFFDRVRDNVRAFVALRNREGSALSIGTSFLVNPWNYQEILLAADNAKEMGVDFIAFNSDIAGMVRKYTPEEIETILKTIETLRANVASGKYGKMNVDIRALSREELEGGKQALPDLEQAKYCEMKVIKANMNPYGVFHLCDYAGQPINERPAVRVGDVYFTSFKEMLHRQISLRFETTNCQGCLLREQGFNIILEKLRADREFGIHLEDQPYRVSLENGVEFLSHKRGNVEGRASSPVDEPVTEELKGKDSFTVELIPTAVPTAPDTEKGEPVGKVGGIDLGARIDVEGETFTLTDIETNRWRIAEGIYYNMN